MKYNVPDIPTAGEAIKSEIGNPKRNQKLG